jgi:predicted nucleic acid-binding protein
MQRWCIQDASKFGRWDYTLSRAALPAGTKYFLSEDLPHERQRKPPP